MKVGLLYPCVAPLCEKMATIFPDLTVIGPAPDDLYVWDPRILPLAKACGRVAEWKEVGLNITFEEKPYSECDFSRFDLLIESVETFNYAKDWVNHCERVECPILTKVCWVNSLGGLPQGYIDKMKDFPVIVEMPSHFDFWKQHTPFSDVSLIVEAVGDWWFERPWTGEKEQVVFVLAGKDLWRPEDRTVCGLDWWDRLCADFPGRVYHQDGAMNFRTARQMTELYSESRLFVNLDRAHARPLAVSFIEALCAGMPVAARKHPTLSYGDFIDSNGVCTANYEEMATFVEHCLADRSYALGRSLRSRSIGTEHFSAASLRPRYNEVAARAQKVYSASVPGSTATD